VQLIQILLPLYDNAGAALSRALFGQVREELTEAFGGLTAFTRAPAEGHWRDEGETTRDDIVVFEVMAQHLDEGWWRTYRSKLEQRFRQDVVVIRAQETRLL
jgi:flavin-binding protein dodecin